jgi:hypothetical protein
MEITITEALAEIKLIDHKMDKKHRFVLNHLVRSVKRVDPLEDKGGSVKVVKQEMQAIDDLGERLVSIRRAISRANQENNIEVNGLIRTIADWLTWRRDVYPRESAHYNNLAKKIVNERQAFGGLGQKYQAAQEITGEDMLVHLDEKDLIDNIESLEETNDRLDGLLSLKNAQIMVEVAG